MGLNDTLENYEDIIWERRDRLLSVSPTKKNAGIRLEVNGDCREND